MSCCESTTAVLRSRLLRGPTAEGTAEHERLAANSTREPTVDGRDSKEAPGGSLDERGTVYRDVLSATHLPGAHSISPTTAERRRRRLDQFEVLRLIGKGAFGKVLLVRYRPTGELFALKSMKKEALLQRNDVGQVRSERNVLALLMETRHAQETASAPHPFVVQLHCAFQSAERVYLVMDFVGGGPLFVHLRREALFGEAVARFYAAEMLVAIEYLHSLGVVHRDLKPENVLLDRDGHLVLTDFGLSKAGMGAPPSATGGAVDVPSAVEDGRYGALLTHSWCGTEDYMPPEVVAREGHSFAADYWSYGCLLYEMLTGLAPFSPQAARLGGGTPTGRRRRQRRTGAPSPQPRRHDVASRAALRERILQAKPRFPHYLTNEAQSLIRRLLCRAPEQRLQHAALLRQHPWFRGVPWHRVEARDWAPPMVPCCDESGAPISPSSARNFARPSLERAVISPRTPPDFALSPQRDAHFHAFTYVAPHAMHLAEALGAAERHSPRNGNSSSASARDDAVWITWEAERESSSASSAALTAPVASSLEDGEEDTAAETAAAVAEMQQAARDACEIFSDAEPSGASA
ncbi:hypothetical protein CDCA_CDCA02G0564 [Cyanidium caldarium]|uniref:non-specific serine/threonine protein kinase n=1 Tax=Cyanidium caldarium TaxID=2771 RepID=A0AAV9IQD8_CYACA|nr:hypothetical protein CDCA_CDCA02G0564 [Cyanidium caldarium]